jgi:hypothetical protein
LRFVAGDIQDLALWLELWELSEADNIPEWWATLLFNLATATADRFP